MKNQKSFWLEMLDAFTEPLRRKGEILVMLCTLCFGFLGSMIGYPFGEFWQITAMFLFALVGLFLGSIRFQK